MLTLCSLLVQYGSLVWFYVLIIASCNPELDKQLRQWVQLSWCKCHWLCCGYYTLEKENGNVTWWLSLMWNQRTSSCQYIVLNKTRKTGGDYQSYYALCYGCHKCKLHKLLGYFSLPYTEVSKLVMLAWVKWQFNCSSNLNVLDYLKV